MKFTSNAVVASLLIIMAVAAVFFISKPANASAPSGLPATVATSSNPSVTTSATVAIAATSTNCAARIISTTGATGIMLTFADITGENPSATVGHWQAASTTVVYDSGLFGCGAVKAYSGVTQTLKVTETR